MSEERWDKLKPEELTGGDPPPPDGCDDALDDEHRLEWLIEQARPEPWPLPRRRSVFSRVFSGRSREDARGWPAGLGEIRFRWSGLRYYWSYAAALVIIVAVWTLIDISLNHLSLTGLGLSEEQVLVFRYEIKCAPAPGTDGLAAETGLTSLDVVMISEQELDEQLETMARRPRFQQTDDEDANEVLFDEEYDIQAEAVWEYMLTAFGDWLEQKRTAGGVPWAKIELQKVYVADGGEQIPNALQIEVSFSGQQPRLRERLAQELAVLFKDIPLVGECTISESKQANF